MYVCYTASKEHRELIAFMGPWAWVPLGPSDCQWLVPGTFDPNKD
jgi:hypothetical protein